MGIRDCEMLPFESCIRKVKYTNKIANQDFKSSGRFPIVSQEEAFISGYWDNPEDVFRIDGPVVIFGDHSRHIKYVDFDFVIGADGVKILAPTDNVNAKYLYYYLKSQPIQSLGYSRHYKVLKDKTVPVPSLFEQQRIVDELDLLSRVIELKNAQLRTLDELAQSIFYEMFGDLITNDRSWNKVILKDICEINPPKREVTSRLSGQDNVSFLPMEDLPVHAGYISVKQTKALMDVAGSYTYFADNDVLLAKVTPCFENGKVGIAHNLDNGVGFGSSEFFVLRSSGKICKETLYFLVQTNTFVNDARKQLTGTSGLRRIPRIFLENLQIGLPPVSEQLSFAQKYKHIFDERKSIASSISAAKDLLASRMYKYFNE